MNPTIPALSAAFLYLVATLLHLAEGRRGALLPRPLVTVGLPALLLHGVASYALLATPSGVNLALWPATVLILFAVNLIVLASGLRKPVLVLCAFSIRRAPCSSSSVPSSPPALQRRSISRPCWACTWRSR
ncbi:MAG: hypothetical protein KatS3mg124_0934 [Porticoccaceae bacterium]|nr:MAG: hypothetical protein KatS3mg124_0934 [Porticoccaceae bacterium]